MVKEFCCRFSNKSNKEIKERRLNGWRSILKMLDFNYGKKLSSTDEA
jgi:hypothetical protein